MQALEKHVPPYQLYYQRRGANRLGLRPLSLSHPLDSRWKDYEMRKGFTRKPQADEPATRGKNYITPSGLQRLKDEHRFLLTRERPAVAEVVAWAS
jgi:Transcription elongation factor, N-terminal